MSKWQEDAKRLGIPMEGIAQASAQDVPERGAGFMPRWKASWYDSPEKRMEAFQSYRPGQEYKIDPETGGIAYRDPGTGEWFLEEPSGVGPGLLGAAATAAGGGIPAELGATIGSLAGPAGTVAGGMLGEGARQMLQAKAGGEPLDAGSALDVGLAGAGGVAGELGSYGLAAAGRGLKRAAQGPTFGPMLQGLGIQTSPFAPGYDPAAAAARQRAGADWGIDLTTPEITGDRSGMVAQQWLQDSPQTASRIGRFLGEREDQIRTAVDDYLGSLGGYGSPELGERRGVAAVNQYADKLRADRANMARPHYQQAEADSADVTPVLGSLDQRISAYPETSSTARHLNRARRLLLERDPDDNLIPSTNVGKLHAAKTDLDDMIERAKRAGDNNLARELTGVQEELLGQLDAGSQAYSEARRVFREESIPINEIDSTLAGQAIGRQDDPTFRLSSKLFGPTSDPTQVQVARAMIQQANPRAWNNVVRSHLQRSFEEVLDPASGDVTNIGGMFRKKVFGNPRRREQLQAALDPDQFERLESLMMALEATGQALKGQSATEPRQAIRREVERQATPGAAALLEPSKTFLRSQFEQRSAKIMDTLADAVINTPSGGQGFTLDRAMRTIRKYGPQELQRDPAKLRAVMAALSQMGIGQLED